MANLQVKLYNKQGRLVSQLSKAYFFSIFDSDIYFLKKKKIPERLSSASGKEKFISKLLFRLEFIIRYEDMLARGEQKRALQKLKKEGQKKKRSLFQERLRKDFYLVSSARRVTTRFKKAIVSPLRAKMVTLNSNIYIGHIDYRLFRASGNKREDRYDVLIKTVKFNKPIRVLKDDVNNLKTAHALMMLFLKNFYMREIKSSVKGLGVFPRMTMIGRNKDEDGHGFHTFWREGDLSKKEYFQALSDNYLESFLSKNDPSSFHKYLLSTGELNSRVKYQKKGNSSITGFQFTFYIKKRNSNFTLKDITREGLKNVLSEAVVR